MRHRRICTLAVLGSALLGVSACGDDAATPPGPGDAGSDGGADSAADMDGECPPAMELAGSTPLPAEIAEIFERRCWACHSDPVQSYAPMPLVDWEDMQARRHEANPEPVYEVIGRRIHDETFPMPPVREPQLTAEDIATLDAWIGDCAPAAE